MAKIPDLDKPETTAFAELPGDFVNPKIVLQAVEGFGKTTIGAYVPDAVMLLADTETGYETLLGVDRVPKRAVAKTGDWETTMELVSQVKGNLVIDELTGLEKQCHEYTKNKYFQGSTEKYFNFWKGPETARDEWMKFISKLQSIDGIVLALCHTNVKGFRDPMAEDYERYVGSMYKKIWADTCRWADVVLFGNYASVIKDGKGIAGYDRTIYTEHRDAYDAKNRYGMPEKIKLPSAEESWNTIWKEIKK